MNWTIIALLIGLASSIGAYTIAVKGFFQTFRLLQILQESDEQAQSDLAHKIITSLKSTLLSLVIATGILYACLIGAGVYIYVENHSSKQAICALRSDLELRTASTNDFLKKHPKGIPGVPVTTLKEGLSNQERSIKALSGVSC